MNKKASKWMIGALALAVLAPTAAFAATNTNEDATKVEQTFHQKRGHYSPEDRQANQQELMQIINKYNPDLADDFQKLFDQQEKMMEKSGLKLRTNGEGKNIDEETKKKIADIQEQVKEGTLTKEQAKEEMEKLGLNIKLRTNGEGKKIDEETKKKLDEIQEQVKEGTLTKEQAKEEMEKLGLKFNVRKFKEIDEETKKKLDAIQEQVKEGTLTKEQAKEEMEKLGLKHVVREGKKIDEETKKKLDEIQEQVKEGTLTKEQAKEEMEKLGLKHAVREGKENIMKQIKEAADADDADTVNKLLQEWLEKMQNKKFPEAKAE
ncbi:hypothetical protein JNUCC42_12940 [Brevibacterium sp. JNUCC-42]|nr:hypothetical protein JNUCC42_12940 [Brevibacterium sp. JNUCC-42]